MVLPKKIMAAVTRVKGNPVYKFFVNPAYTKDSSETYFKKNFGTDENSIKYWNDVIIPNKMNFHEQIKKGKKLDPYRHVQWLLSINKDNTQATDKKGNILGDTTESLTHEMMTKRSSFFGYTGNVESVKVAITKKKLVTKMIALLKDLNTMIKYISGKPFYWWIKTKDRERYETPFLYDYDLNNMKKDENTNRSFLDNINKLMTTNTAFTDTEIFELLCSNEIGPLGQEGTSIQTDRKEVQEILAVYLDTSNKVMNCEVTPLISRLKF
jgi:hypothetical protein